MPRSGRTFEEGRIYHVYNRVGGGWMAFVAALFITFVLASTAVAGQPPAGVGGEEWRSIQGQIEAERHKITDSDRPGKLYLADNPTQRFSAHFGDDDLVIVPRDRGEPAWQLGLRLTTWGAAHDLQPVHPATTFAESNRVEYRRGTLTEWYLNTAMGLEQGFTIDAPPTDDITELVLEMAIVGDLTPVLSEDGQSVRFRQQGSNSALTYSGLKAWDAVGESLEDRMALVSSGTKLRIIIDVEEAIWPVSVDPTFYLVQKIRSPLDPDPYSGRFGLSIDLDGDWMVVGRLGEVSYGTVGAHIYRRDENDPTVWDHVVEIEPDDDDAGGDHVAVAISGDVVVIGVPGSAPSGKAYVFQRNHSSPDTWGQIATIDPIDGNAREFGSSVAMSSNTVVIGAPSTDHSDGAAYVFERDHGGPDAWGLVAKIASPNPGGAEHLGSSVALSGETAVIGPDYGSALVCYRNQGGPDSWDPVAAIGQRPQSVAVSGDTAIIGIYGSDGIGAIDVFERHFGGLDVWGHVKTVFADDPESGDKFGDSVAIDGTTVVVGAWRDSDAAVQAGSAYIFERNHGGNGTWGQVTKISVSNPSQGENFGWAVALSGDTAVIGTPGSYQFDEFESVGSTYVFERDQGGAGTWGVVVKIPGPPFLSAWFNHFGTSVDMEGDTVVIGSPRKRGWVHIYRKTSEGTGIWERLTRITADNDESPWEDHFGFSTAISGDTVVVGAHGDNVYDPPDIYYDIGSAYVFKRNQGGVDNWGLVARLFAHTWEYFGYSVAIDGDTVVVGGEGSLYWGVPPAHVFQSNYGGSNAWGHVAELIPSDAGAYAPRRRVALSGNTAVVGWFDNGLLYVFERNQGGPDAWGETARIEMGQWGGDFAISEDTLIAGDISINHPTAQIYQRNQGIPGSWSLVTTITPPDGIVDDNFGTSVSIDGDIAVVGSWDHNEPGAIYSFHRNQGGTDAWGMVSMFNGFNNYARFGQSISISGGVAIVGAPDDYEAGMEAGAAYIFTISDALFADGFESGDTAVWSATEP